MSSDSSVVVTVNCEKDGAKCAEYLERGYVQVSDRKLVDPFPFADRFTNHICVKAFQQQGILEDVVQFAFNVEPEDRADPIRYSSNQMGENSWILKNKGAILIVVGVISAFANLHLFIAAVRNVKRNKYSHILLATLFGTLFLLCGVELSITTILFDILEIVVTRQQTPKLHQLLKTITDARKRIVGAVTCICLVFIAIDRLIHLRNAKKLSLSRKRWATKMNAVVFLGIVLFAVVNCVVMSFLENHWRANKKGVDDPNDEDVLYYSAYKLFDNNMTSFNVLRTMDLFDAMIPVTYCVTLVTCTCIYILIGYEVIRSLIRIKNSQLEVSRILRKSIHTIALNLVTVVLFAICWFPYAIIDRYSEMKTNCGRAFYSQILLQFDPDSAGWNTVTLIYALNGILFYFFALFNSLIFLTAHKHYGRTFSCCKKKENDPIEETNILMTEIT